MAPHDPAKCLAEPSQGWMQSGLGWLAFGQSGQLPHLDILHASISDATSLFVRQFPRQHGSNDGLSTHALLLPNLLHTQPADFPKVHVNGIAAGL